MDDLDRDFSYESVDCTQDGSDETLLTDFFAVVQKFRTFSSDEELKPLKPPLDLVECSSQRKGVWSAEENEQLVATVTEHGAKHWTQIARFLPNRSGKQCRERWFNHLQPGVQKGDWSTDEDQVILRMHGTLGNKWAEIARQLPGRTDNAVKNHFYGSLRKLASCTEEMDGEPCKKRRRSDEDDELPNLGDLLSEFDVLQFIDTRDADGGTPARAGGVYVKTVEKASRTNERSSVQALTLGARSSTDLSSACRSITKLMLRAAASPS